MAEKLNLIRLSETRGAEITGIYRNEETCVVYNKDIFFSLFDQHYFVELRNIVCVRLTIFNARRGARFLIEEWRDAENDTCIDKQRSEVLDPIEKSLLKTLNISYQGEH